MGMPAARAEFGRPRACKEIGPFLFLASPISKIFSCCLTIRKSVFLFKHLIWYFSIECNVKNTLPIKHRGSKRHPWQ